MTQHQSNKPMRFEFGIFPMLSLLVGYLLLCAWAWPFTMDDAFISFRYAKHIGDGVGPIWNLADAAQPVEGFTSFAYVWFLGWLRFLTGFEPIMLGKGLGVVAGVGLAVSILHASRTERLGGFATALALSVLLLPFTALNAVSGMETSLFMLFNWFGALICVRLLDAPTARTTWVFALSGLLGTLTRPEYAAVFGLMVACVWWRCPSIRPTLLRAIVVLFLVPGAAITAWRFAFYGDVLPKPFYVKQRLSIYGSSYVVRFLSFCALPYLLLAVTGWRRLWTAHRNLLLVVALNVTLPCLYFCTTTPTMGWWYRFLYPQIPLLAFAAAVAIDERAGAVHAPLGFWRTAALALMILLPLAHIPVVTRFLTFHPAQESNYREIGRRLRPFASPERWLLYVDVGVIPYESEWNTIDQVGLNTHRSRLGSPCAMQTDLVLRFTQFPTNVPNPCPGLYEQVVALPLIRQEGIADSVMHIFMRKNLVYADALRTNLLEGWPGPFTRPTDWLARYWRQYHRVFFQ